MGAKGKKNKPHVPTKKIKFVGMSNAQLKEREKYVKELRERGEDTTEEKIRKDKVKNRNRK